MLGFVVWHGAQWYVRRRVSQAMPSRRVTTAVLVAGAVATVAAVSAARRDTSA